MKEMKKGSGAARMDENQLEQISGGVAGGETAGTCEHLNLIHTEEIREERFRNRSLRKRERKFHCADCGADIWKVEFEWTGN